MLFTEAYNVNGKGPPPPQDEQTPAKYLMLLDMNARTQKGHNASVTWATIRPTWAFTLYAFINARFTWRSEAVNARWVWALYTIHPIWRVPLEESAKLACISDHIFLLYYSFIFLPQMWPTGWKWDVTRAAVMLCVQENPIKKLIHHGPPKVSMPALAFMSMGVDHSLYKMEWSIFVISRTNECISKILLHLSRCPSRRMRRGGDTLMLNWIRRFEQHNIPVSLPT